MNQFLFIALIAVGLPLSFANYENKAYSSDGGNKIASNGDGLSNQALDASLYKLQKDVDAVDANPDYKNYENSEYVNSELLESNLANKLRQGNLDVVPKNVIDQASYRSLLVPYGKNTRVIANKPLPPVVINQPPSAPITVASGLTTVVRSSPVIYKIKPSIYYQNEVINKVPTPINLHPIYVKVFKSGETVDVPTYPIVEKYSKPSYNAQPAYTSYNTENSYDNSYTSSHDAASAPASYQSKSAQGY